MAVSERLAAAADSDMSDRELEKLVLGVLADGYRSGTPPDPEHRIRFVFTPRHASWLNMVELWFSVLARRFLRRQSFVSLEDLRIKLLAFIEYFNEVLAHPYRWTYTGRPLRA